MSTLTVDPLPDLCVPSQVVKEFKYLNKIINQEEFFKVTSLYPFVSTLYYLSLAGENINDPIMKQLCPSLDELSEDVFCSEDPLNEEESSPIPGLVHRYPDRVLMVVTNICFMNCRHCTRKRLWKFGRYACSHEEIKAMIDYIRKHPEVRDVIISGGDPLTFSDDYLDEILTELRSIPHVEIIRIGTRAPVVNPQRITDSLVKILSKHRPLWLNTQFNHVREITELSKDAIEKIILSGVPVNNQTVLLKGVNDSSKDMLDLCHALLRIGVRPYYLFHCDPVSGVSHFRTSIAKGIEIIEKMRGHTSGLAVPNFVVDAVGGGGKIPVSPNYVLASNENEILLRNYQHQKFIYSERQA